MFHRLTGLYASRGMLRRKEAAPVAESLHSGCYAVSAREVAAVRLGVGRGARHEIILRSGVRLPVPYAQATLLADKIWDGVWPDGAARRSRKRTRVATPARASRSAGTSTSTIRQAIIQTLTKETQTPGSKLTSPSPSPSPRAHPHPRPRP